MHDHLTVNQNTPYMTHCKPNPEKNASFFGPGVSCQAVRLREKIIGLCELRGWSYRQLAIKAGVTPSALLHAMNGHEIGVDKAIKLAREMGVTVDWLFDDRKAWDDLPGRLYWLPPDTEPTRALAAKKGFQEAMKKGPENESRIAGERHKKKLARRPNTAQKAADRGMRRKSASGDD